jgi:PEP-CTERM motif
MRKAALNLAILFLFLVPASADTVLNYVLSGYHTGTISWEIPQNFVPASFDPTPGASSFVVDTLTNFGPASIHFYEWGDLYAVCGGCPEGFFYVSGPALYIAPPPFPQPWVPTLLTGTFQVSDLYDFDGDGKATLTVTAADIPEPASLVLLGSGLLGLGTSIRRKLFN